MAPAISSLPMPIHIDAAAGGRDYSTTLEDLDRYFLAFALAARAGR